MLPCETEPFSLLMKTGQWGDIQCRPVSLQATTANGVHKKITACIKEILHKAWFCNINILICIWIGSCKTKIHKVTPPHLSPENCFPFCAHPNPPTQKSKLKINTQLEIGFGWVKAQLQLAYPTSEFWDSILFIICHEIGLHVLHPVPDTSQDAVRLICSTQTRPSHHMTDSKWLTNTVNLWPFQPLTIFWEWNRHIHPVRKEVVLLL